MGKMEFTHFWKRTLNRNMKLQSKLGRLIDFKACQCKRVAKLGINHKFKGRLVNGIIFYQYCKCAAPSEDIPWGTLRKQAYSNILEILPPKYENFQIKNSDIHISAQNIDCGYSLEPPRRGGSNEYPQSRFLSRNKKNNVIPVNPSFTL